MREKVVGNAVCQVRTSQTCHGLNPRESQIEHKGTLWLITISKLPQKFFVFFLSTGSLMFCFDLCCILTDKHNWDHFCDCVKQMFPRYVGITVSRFAVCTGRCDLCKWNLKYPLFQLVRRWFISFFRKLWGTPRGQCSESAEQSHWGFCSQYRSNSQNSWSYIAHNAAVSKTAWIIVPDLTKCHTSHREPQLFLQAVSSSPWLVN